MEYEFDLVVIGGGSGGVRAARMAAESGARVALVEARELGGTCVNRGCVPKKLFVYGARHAHALHDAAAYGWTVDAPRFDWKTLVANKDREIARLNGIYRRLLGESGVELVHGFAKLADAHTVLVDGRSMSTERILLAVGGAPHAVAIPGHELAKTSDDLFHLEEFPRRIVIAGAGYIGIEFACIFRMLGAEVHVVQRSAEILSGFDDEMRAFLRDQLQVEGIHFHCGRTIERIEARDGDGICAHLDDGAVLSADVQAVATGRRPLTRGIGLEEVGVEMDARGVIPVDDEYRTNVPNIFALGDIIDRLPLTPMAIAEAIAFVSTQFLGRPQTIDYETVPTAIFSTPTFATVGLTEEQAWARGANVHVYCSTFRPMKDVLPDRAGRSRIKIIVDERDDRVLGVHVINEDAAEMVQAMAVAMRCGLTKKQLDTTIGIHPTVAEELVQMRQPVRTGVKKEHR